MATNSKRKSKIETNNAAIIGSVCVCVGQLTNLPNFRTSRRKLETPAQGANLVRFGNLHFNFLNNAEKGLETGLITVKSNSLTFYS